MVAVRQREQELGPDGMRELRPLPAPGVGLEAVPVDDRLVLVRVDRADRVDDRAARSHALGGNAQQIPLQLGKWLAPPAQVGPRGEHAQPRAWGVDEHAVELTEAFRKRERVRVDDAYVGRSQALAIRLQLARAAGVLL